MKPPIMPDLPVLGNGVPVSMGRKAGLRIGGVMRCCAETLNTTQVREVAGEVLKCKYCSSSLIFRDGAWEWNREPNDCKHRV